MNSLPYRQIHLDFHTSPLIPDIGSEFDADEFGETLKQNGINSINLFAKCHHGMYYYPTKIGAMHPNLKIDLLGAQIKACRDRGIRTCVYTTVVWNEDWCDRHPEWMQISKDGVIGVKKPFEAANSNWRSLCMNKGGLVEYMKAELKEIYDLYQPDGYWIDIIMQHGCVCPDCRAGMRKLGLDPRDDGDVLRFGRLIEIRFMKDIYAYLMGIDASIGVYFNGHPNETDLADDKSLSAKRKRENNSYVDIESLPSDIWGYTHYPAQVNYLNKYDQETCMMNGKFHTAWGDFGSLRNLEALEYECFRALANGSKVNVGDQLHPSGKIDKTVYGRIGQVFKQIERMEPYCVGSKKVAQIGVYTPNRVLGFAPKNNAAPSPSEANASATTEGVLRILTELRHQFDFVDYEDPVDRYELVILPDSVRLPGEVAQRLDAYLKKGGKLLITNKAGLLEAENQFALPDFGVEFVSDAAYNPRYTEITPAAFPGIPPMLYATYERGATVRADPGAEVLARIANPYFNRTWEHFSSHRHTPAQGVTDEPAVVKNGNVIYIANPLFCDYATLGCKVFKDIVARCIGMLLPEPLVVCGLPSAAEITVRKQDGRYLLHILSYVIQRKSRTIDIIEDRFTLYNKKIALRVGGRPKRISLFAAATDIGFEYADGYASFEIPIIDGHEIVAVEQ